ncbi:MAG: T9SS type A sorting domain-containing protein [Flavobacteriaceae bacterium]
MSTNSGNYESIRDLTSDLVSLASEGDFYVAASINGKADAAGSIGEYKLEYSIDAGNNWSDLGLPVRRSMLDSSDDSIISLVGLLQGNKGIHSNYQFRVSYRLVAGFSPIITHNSNLVVVSLTHSNGFFPTYFSQVNSPGVDIIGVSTPSALVTSVDFISVADIDDVGPDLYVHTQYIVSADGLNEATPQRMKSSNQLFLDQGITFQLPAEEYFRYIGDNSSFGSGGFIGLVEDLASETTYTVSMFHEIDNIYAPDGIEDEILTTSEVVLAGFQTYDMNVLVLANDDAIAEDEIKLFGSLGKIEIRSNEPIDAEIKIYNILGKVISTNRVYNQSDISIDIDNFKGIAIVSIITEGRVITKKVIL